MKLRVVSLLMVSCAGAFWASSARATVDDPGFEETRFASGMTVLTGLAWAPDGSNRLFVSRKHGFINVIENGVPVPTPFATVAPLITTSECGVIGLALDPNFAMNGYVYAFVSVSSTEQQIVRYTANGNVGIDMTVIVAGLPTRGINHDGGALGFGPDGKLYWAIGDNGSPRRGVDADLLSLAAKVGRANADGSVPTDNPFFDGDGPNNDYVWARGFRNPFTLTFQPATGRLWLNVVGNHYEQVFTPQAGDHGGWDNLESNQPAGFLPPTISYPTNDPMPLVIGATGAVRQAGVVTITTTLPHRLRPSSQVAIADVVDPSFNTPASFISSVDELSFKFLQAGPDLTSGGGTATAQRIGGCATGGTFWDSTGVPAEYRGNFFWGDYNTGALMRAELDKNNQVTAVKAWGSDFPKIVDMAIGPDGDMYYGAQTGGIFHARYTATAVQTIVVSQQNVRMSEGGRAGFGVRLALATTNDRVVTTEWLSGDADVTVVEGSSLTFTSANWATPQRVLLAAAHDSDSIEDTAKLRVASGGVGKPIVTVRVTDDESFAIVAPSAIQVDEGASVDFAVSLTQPPTVPLEVAVARTSGDAGASVTAGALLAFDSSNWSTPQPVTVSAAEDADAERGTATLTLTATGLSPRDVVVTVRDNEEHAPEFTSAPLATAVVGVPYAYDADAEGLPEPVFVLDEAPTGMTIDPSSGVIAWTPGEEVDAAVIVRATNGVAPDAVQSFEIDVVPDQPPSCSITLPVDGAVVSGSDAELFGDVFDDVGAVRAEFLIDGELAFEDVSDEGHYHFGGSHNLFDTTQLADGEHVLAMRGYDTSGQSCLTEVSIIVENAEIGVGAGGAGGGGSVVEDGGAPGTATEGDAGAGTTVGVGEAGAGQVGRAPPADGTSGAGSSDEGCGCRVGASRRPRVGSWALLLVGLGALGRRRRRTSALRLRQ